ncbi:hypothetical protein C0Q44_05575 [Paenibacillus sp. PCH8]|nr:hypothetical protein C0Q44_05575 [Paenibacillus sp. PCH8]
MKNRIPNLKGILKRNRARRKKVTKIFLALSGLEDDRHEWGNGTHNRTKKTSTMSSHIGKAIWNIKR